MIEIGEHLVEARKKKGFSQEFVAEQLNISRQSVSLWECNKTQPTLDNLISLSELYDVNIAFLFGQVNLNQTTVNINSDNKFISDGNKNSCKYAIYYKVSILLSILLMLLFIVPGISIVLSTCVIILSILSLKVKRTNIATLTLIIGIVYSLASLFVMINMSEIYQLFNR